METNNTYQDHLLKDINQRLAIFRGEREELILSGIRILQKELKSEKDVDTITRIATKLIELERVINVLGAILAEGA
jgi:DNA polymerase III delta prime subunit